MARRILSFLLAVTFMVMFFSSPALAYGYVYTTGYYPPYPGSFPVYVYPEPSTCMTYPPLVPYPYYSAPAIIIYDTTPTYYAPQQNTWMMKSDMMYRKNKDDNRH